MIQVVAENNNVFFEHFSIFFLNFFMDHIFNKLNFDVAVFANGEASGVGAVVCNKNGDAVAGLWLHYQRKGMQWLIVRGSRCWRVGKLLEFSVDAGFSDLIIEGDNVTVMKTISSAQHNLS